MVGIRWLLIAVLLTSALPSARAARPSRAREEWMAGYIKLEEGAKAEEAGRAAAALDLYRQALVVFREVQRKYPSWNPSLLTYRITSCQTRIERLQGSVSEEAATMKKADLEVVVRNQVAKIRELADANRALKTDLAETRDALERARTEAARSVGRDTDVRDLVKERKTLRDQLAAQTAESARLTEELRQIQAKGGLKTMADRLQVQLDQVRASKAKFEKSYETYRQAYENVKARLQGALDAREKDIAYVGRLRERALTAEQRADASADALAKLQGEWQSMKDGRSEAEAEAKTKAAEAEAAEARLEPLRLENQQLRKYRDQATQEAGRSAELQKQVRELLAAKAAAVAQTEGLRADVERSIATAAGLERDLTTLREQTAGTSSKAKERVAALEKQLGELQATKKGLDEQLADLGKERTEHQRAKAQWEEDRKRLLAASTSGSAAGNEVKGLRAEREKLIEQVRGLTAAKQQVDGGLAALAKELTEQKATAQELQAALATAKQEKNGGEAEALQQALAKMAATQEAKELAETRLAEAERRLKASEAVAASQKRLLAATEKTGDERADLGRQLSEREQRLEAAQAELKGLTKRLDLAEKTAARSSEEARSSGFEVSRLRGRLKLAEKRVQDLDQQLANQRRDRKLTAAEETAPKRLQEAAKMIEALENESKSLKAKSGEQLQLLRAQEKAIAKLERAKADLDKEMAERDRHIEKLKADQEFLKAKTGVADGLAGTLQEVDTQLAIAKREQKRLEDERDRAVVSSREYRARLETARSELTKTRDLLSRKSVPGAAGDLFRDQIRRLTLQLEKESQRRRTLEELLSKEQSAAAEVAATDEAPGLVLPAGERVLVYEGAKFPEVAERAERVRRRNLLVRGHLHQGVAAEKAGNVEAARWNYAKVLESDSNNRLATQRLGLIAAELGEDREAIRFLKRAFRLDSDDLDTLLPLGFALVRQDEPDLAVSMLSRAVALEPDNPHAHRCLGIACSTLGWYEAAEVQFRRTHKLNPKDAENAFNLAVLLATRKPPRLEEAKTWYVQARELGAAADPGLDRVFGIKPVIEE